MNFSTNIVIPIEERNPKTKRYIFVLDRNCWLKSKALQINSMYYIWWMYYNTCSCT